MWGGSHPWCCLASRLSSEFSSSRSMISCSTISCCWFSSSWISGIGEKSAYGIHAEHLNVVQAYIDRPPHKVNYTYCITRAYIWYTLLHCFPLASYVPQNSSVEYIIIACVNNLTSSLSALWFLVTRNSYCLATIMLELSRPTVTATKYIVVKVTFLLFRLLGVYIVACVTLNEELGHCGTVLHMCMYILY